MALFTPPSTDKLVSVRDQIGCRGRSDFLPKAHEQLCLFRQAHGQIISFGSICQIPKSLISSVVFNTPFGFGK